MNPGRGRKSIYIPEDINREIQAQSDRLDRSYSWIIQQLWRLAKDKIVDLPSPNDPPPVH